MDEFTCLVYGQNRESSMDGLRAKPLRKIVREDEKLTSKLKVDLARLPPCHPALKPHIQRVNHRVALYKRADESILEKPNPYDNNNNNHFFSANILEDRAQWRNKTKGLGRLLIKNNA